jgi:hypothetical protein
MHHQAPHALPQEPLHHASSSSLQLCQCNPLDGRLCSAAACQARQHFAAVCRHICIWVVEAMHKQRHTASTDHHIPACLLLQQRCKRLQGNNDNSSNSSMTSYKTRHGVAYYTASVRACCTHMCRQTPQAFESRGCNVVHTSELSMSLHCCPALAYRT